MTPGGSDGVPPGVGRNAYRPKPAVPAGELSVPLVKNVRYPSNVTKFVTIGNPNDASAPGTTVDNRVWNVDARRELVSASVSGAADGLGLAGPSVGDEELGSAGRATLGPGPACSVVPTNATTATSATAEPQAATSRRPRRRQRFRAMTKSRPR